MAWWAKAGYGTEELLTSATVNGSELMNRHGVPGRLTPGHSAHIVGFKMDKKGNPILTGLQPLVLLSNK